MLVNKKLYIDNGDLKTTQKLLDEGADVNAATKSEGHAALNMENYPEITRTLTENFFQMQLLKHQQKNQHLWLDEGADATAVTKDAGNTVNDNLMSQPHISARPSLRDLVKIEDAVKTNTPINNLLDQVTSYLKVTDFVVDTAVFVAEPTSDRFVTVLHSATYISDIIYSSSYCTKAMSIFDVSQSIYLGEYKNAIMKIVTHAVLMGISTAEPTLSILISEAVLINSICTSYQKIESAYNDLDIEKTFVEPIYQAVSDLLGYNEYSANIDFA